MKPRLLPGVCMLLYAGTSLAQHTFADTVYFDRDRASLNYATLTVLNSAAAWAKENDTYRIHFKTHADTTGEFVYNRKLAMRRALTARAYLVALGLDSTRITWREHKPLQSPGGDTSETGSHSGMIGIHIVSDTAPAVNDTFRGSQTLKVGHRTQEEKHDSRVCCGSDPPAIRPLHNTERQQE